MMALRWLACAVLLLAAAPAHGQSYCTSWQTCWPRSFNTFIARLSNESEVYAPSLRDQAGYLSRAQAMQNTLKADFPGIIVYPASEADLSVAIKFATNNRIRVVAKCSGHDQNCRSTGRSVMQVVMTKFNGMLYNPDDTTFSFQAGLNHYQLYSYLANYNRVMVGGQFKTVCPAGCLTGGCHGPLTRQYGLGIDNVLAVQIMLYNGTAIYATAALNSDLFHALLGGGASSFGVVMGFTVKTYPAPPYVLQMGASFSLMVPGEDDPYHTVLSTFFFNATWWGLLPHGLAGYLTVSGYKAIIDFVYTGRNETEALDAVQPLLDSPFLDSDSLTLANHTNLAEYSNSAYSTAGLYTRRFVLNSLVPAVQPALDTLTAAALTYPEMPVWVWYTYGGAVRNGTAGCVPPGMRQGMIQINTAALWANPEEDEDHIAGISAAGPIFYGLGASSYTNEYTAWGAYNNLTDWKTRFFTGYSNLLAVKKKYDPCNLYSVQFGIGSDLPKATCRRNLLVKPPPPAPPRPSPPPSPPSPQPPAP